jgi:hypothetical protein
MNQNKSNIISPHNKIHYIVLLVGWGKRCGFVREDFCATGGCLFFIPPPRLTLLKVMAQGEPNEKLWRERNVCCF